MPRYVPNIITSVRFLLVPLYVIVFYSDIEYSLIYSVIIFALAGITDVIDGNIARKYDLITKLGTVLDPLADKLMQLAVLITFTTKGYIPLWAIAIIGIKEVLMIIGGLVLYYGKSDAVIPSNRYGKLATVVFYITVFTVAYKSDSLISLLLITTTVLLTLVAFINYFIGFAKISKETNREEV